MSKKKASGIYIRGAREHNLKNISLFIPHNKMTVITGISGSGKSTLAFDTLYAEGQRRYVEGLSTYARQFLEQFKKPDVDSISGLSPAISIEQKTSVVSPRSTVGTITEIYDYLRLLYSKIAIPYCPTHHIPLEKLNLEYLYKELSSLKEGTRLQIYSPVIRNKKGEFNKEFEQWSKLGYIKAKVDGELVDITPTPKLLKNKVHAIDLLVDRLIIKKSLENRLKESLSLALRLSKGFLVVENLESNTSSAYAESASCPICQYSPPEIEPRLFSFNDPRGSCEECHGLGFMSEESDGEDLDTDNADDSLGFVQPCPKCHGARLKESVLNIFISDRNIYDVSCLSLDQLSSWIKDISLDERMRVLLDKLIFRLIHKISFLQQLGLSYLSLSRPARSLSGGEAQRIRLANQLGSPLVGVLYVLDEPSIGLHSRDQKNLLGALEKLKNRGNTVVVVEHDEETIRSSDSVIDIGPGAGRLGGHVIAHGSPKEIEDSKESLTGKFLSGEKSSYVLRKQKLFDEFLHIQNARGNNLKGLSCKIPLNALTTITGVSGSGKSTLIIDTLYHYLSNQFYVRSLPVAPFDSITGYRSLSGIIEINQKPIGRTPRSNPSTYVGLFSLIRDLFAQLPESRMRGYKPGRFSFNVKGGRCESCQGGGQIRVEMHFMADVFVPCDVCSGKRYNSETLNIHFKGKSISDVLDMTIEDALSFFENQPFIKQKLDILMQVGLGYLTLGQYSTTLSGGEAQRIKLAKELSKKRSGQLLYILDEPSTGLHFEDTKKLIELLQKLTEMGHTVITIEHNLDIIASSDYIIDLGPEGGEGGGQIICSGHPEEIIKDKISYTASFLKEHLKRPPQIL